VADRQRESRSTMGYGDITPVTTNERVFIVLVALIGAVSFSYCLSNISGLVLEAPGREERFRDKIKAVSEYLQFREVREKARERE
jgi:hypothetical protein